MSLEMKVQEWPSLPPGLGVRLDKSARGRDVHVMTTTQAIGKFMGGDKSTLVCFRCGQVGHVRFQCLQYKVRLCMHFERGDCNDPMCSYAHGKDELRTPWKARCVRVVKQSGKLVCIGCNSTEHTFRKCPFQQGEFEKIGTVITSLERS